MMDCDQKKVKTNKGDSRWKVKAFLRKIRVLCTNAQMFHSTSIRYIANEVVIFWSRDDFVIISSHDFTFL